MERAENETCSCGRRRGDCPAHRLVLHHDYGRSKDNCVVFEVVAAAREAGYGARVGAWICGSRDKPFCPHFRDCLYQSQHERPGSHVSTVEVVTQRPTSTEQMGVVMFDDLDSARLIARTQVTAQTVQRAGRVSNAGAVALLLPVLKQVLGTARSEGTYHREAYEALDDAATALGSSLEEILSAIPPVKAFAPAPTAEAYRAAVPGQLLDLVQLLHEEYPLYRAGAPFTSGLRITPAGLDVARLMLPVAKADGQTGLTGRAVAVLSSTPDPVLRQWVGQLDLEVVKEYRPSVALPDAVRVVQDVSAFHGKHSTEQDEGRRLLAAARRYLAEFRPQRPAVVTFKAIREDVSASLGIPLERVLYFGNLRGANALRDADLLLVLGTPGMDPAAAYWNACAAYRGAGPPLSRRMVMTPQRYGGWADAQGRGRQVSVLTFADARVAEIYETARRDELLQAVYRCRPHDLGRERSAGDRRALTVVLVTEQPVAGLRVDELRFGGNAARAEEAEARIGRAVKNAEVLGLEHTARSLAEAASTGKDRASVHLRKVSAACPPTSIRDLIQVGGQTAETSPLPETDMQLAWTGGCSCVRCPANRGDRCNCGRFWFSARRRPHCGVHFPPAESDADDAEDKAPRRTEAMRLE